MMGLKHEEGLGSKQPNKAYTFSDKLALRLYIFIQLAKETHVFGSPIISSDWDDTTDHMETNV